MEVDAAIRRVTISTQAEGTFCMFSSPMTGEEFLKKINASF